MNKGRKLLLGVGVVFFGAVFGGAASAISSSEILLLNRLRARHGYQPRVAPVAVEARGTRDDGDLCDLLEKLQYEERERRLLDSLLSQIVNDLEKEKQR